MQNRRDTCHWFYWHIVHVTPFQMMFGHIPKPLLMMLHHTRALYICFKLTQLTNYVETHDWSSSHTKIALWSVCFTLLFENWWCCVASITNSWKATYVDPKGIEKYKLSKDRLHILQYFWWKTNKNCACQQAIATASDATWPDSCTPE